MNISMSNLSQPEEYSRLVVEEGRYIPQRGDVYDSTNPHAHVNGVDFTKEMPTFDANYPYIDHSFKQKFWVFLYYARARYIIRPLHFLLYGFRGRGYENIRKNKELFKNGGLTVCNHTYRWDVAGVMDALGWGRLWFPIWREQLAGPDGRHMRAMGGIPVPDSVSALRKFYAAFDEVHARKEWIHFFAEEARWDYYVPIRPFKKGAFVFALRYNLPIVPMAVSFRERTGFLKWFGKDPCVTLNVGEPILPNMELKDKNAIIDDLRKRTHEAIVKLAGIKDNPWAYNETEK